MPVRLLVPGVTLIDDGIDGDRRFAVWRSPISRWPRPIGTIESMAINPVCNGWFTGKRSITPGSDALNRAALCRIDGTLAVNRLSQGIHHAPNHRLADRDLHDTSSAPDFIALFNLRIELQHGPTLSSSRLRAMHRKCHAGIVRAPARHFSRP